MELPDSAFQDLLPPLLQSVKECGRIVSVLPFVGVVEEGDGVVVGVRIYFKSGETVVCVAGRAAAVGSMARWVESKFMARGSDGNGTKGGDVG